MFRSHSINRAWAILFARLVLGLMFFMAGFWKVFQLGPLEHARKFFLPYADKFLPSWSLWGAGVVIPFVELLAGGLVILGLRTREALISLGFVLAVVTFGHLLKEPLYEFHTHVIPRLALLLFVLLLPREVISSQQTTCWRNGKRPLLIRGTLPLEVPPFKFLYFDFTLNRPQGRVPDLWSATWQYI